MDPSIAAAWIGAGVGGGVALVGVAASIVSSIVSSNNTRKATERTVEAGADANRATLTAAREDGFWEKQCAAYDLTLEGLLQRQARRQHELRPYRLDEDSEEQLKSFFDSYESPGWFQAHARLTAYASDAVLKAFDETTRADSEVRGHYEQWKMLFEDAKLAAESGRMDAAAQDSELALKARRNITPALAEAQEKDQALIKLIREELRSKPEATSVAVTVPAERRRRWHRR